MLKTRKKAESNTSQPLPLVWDDKPNEGRKTMVKLQSSMSSKPEHDETAEDAVRREVLEETGVAYEIDHLAVIHENFFREKDGTLAGREGHEITLYFRMKPRGSRELHSESRTAGVRETMHWLPIDRLREYRAYPTFMQAYLQSPHTAIEHIVTDERAQ